MAGRPSAYRPEHCKDVVELGRAGKSVAQMCAHFDISRQTIDNWAAAHPEFLEALSRAKVHAQAWWEERGVSGMTADKFNAAVWKKSMEARFREDYTERQEFDHKSSDGSMTPTRIELVAPGYDDSTH
jgi:hypothetical protein